MPVVPTNTTEALDALEQEYEKTLNAAASIDSAAMIADTVEGGMSPKDVLAHLAWWNWEAPTAVQRIRSDEVPWWIHVDLDQVNAGTLAERKDWSIENVMDDLRRSHLALSSALESVSPGEFYQPTTHLYQTGPPVGMQWLFYIYIEHYEQHRRQLEPEVA